MRYSKASGWALVAFMFVAVSQITAEQSQAPILRPRPTKATILVKCDLACNWKLDGKSEGTIALNDSKIVSITLG